MSRASVLSMEAIAVRKAERLGAEVALLSPHGGGERLGRQAVADGAGLLGVADGMGPRPQVTDTAAGQGLPVLVISAGTCHQLARLPVVAGDVRPRATTPTGSAEDHGGSSPRVEM